MHSFFIFVIMKNIFFVLGALSMLSMISCKKKGMDVYVGSWYVKNEKIEYVALDSIAEKVYEEGFLFKFEKEGAYHSIKSYDTTYTGSWSVLAGNESELYLDGLKYNVLDKNKHGFTLKKADVGIDSVLIQYVLERNH